MRNSNCPTGNQNENKIYLFRVSVIVILAVLFLSLNYSFKDGETVLLNDEVAEITGAAMVRDGIVDNLQLDGRGIIVGIADSGLDTGKVGNLIEDFQNQYKLPKVVYLRSISGAESAADLDGHGTHMAGIIAGNGSLSNGKYMGIAPGANLYVQSLVNARGEIEVPNTVDKVFQPAFDAGVRIHVNGWGRQENRYTERTLSIDSFIEKNPDFLAIFSAGNNGEKTGTVTAEANSKNALVVGAGETVRPIFSSDAMDTNKVFPTSSAGPTIDGRIKPDLIAPGSAIISTASSLTESNFSANSHYTILGGSSMAAAVAGGCSALLADYLHEKYSKDMSSALLKALLIQGADANDEDWEHYGFGILNLGTTILSLDAETISFEDCKTPLSASDAKDFYFDVSDTNCPFTAVLVWVDPAGNVNSHNQLVNNLNLEVIAPDGSIAYGNDFDHHSVIDRINNVERVIIKKPQEGTYTIRVAAENIAGNEQNFTIVYGQNAEHSTVVEKKAEGSYVLANGELLNMAGKTMILDCEGILKNHGNLENGTEVYYTSQKVYALTNYWNEDGVQILQDNNGYLVTQMNITNRADSYYIDENWLDKEQRILQYNESPRYIKDIPGGVGIKSIINPISQSLYGVQTSGTFANGIVDSIDLEEGKLILKNNSNPFFLSDLTAVSYTNTEVEGAPEGRPFGYMNLPNQGEILSGMKVNMLINDSNRQIYSIELERPTVFDIIIGLDLENKLITMGNGSTYQITEQTRITRNGGSVLLDEVNIGDWVGCVKGHNDNNLLSVEVMDQIYIGKIIYVGSSSKTIYMVDQYNQSQEFLIDDATVLMRGRAVVGLDAISNGAWARIIMNKNTGNILRMDIVSGVQEETYTINSYNEESRTLTLEDNRQYSVYDSTLFVREGQVVSADNIMAGEKAQLTILPGSTKDDYYLARVDLYMSSGYGKLLSDVEAHIVNNELIVSGNTYGLTFIIYRNDGVIEKKTLSETGPFIFLLTPKENEKDLLISVQNFSTREVDLIRIPIENAEFYEASLGEFKDLNNCIYRTEINALVDAGYLTGYDDDTFHPNEKMTRMSFLVLLIKATGDLTPGDSLIGHYADARDIPWWGIDTVNTIATRDWKAGFEDEMIRPNELLTAEDAALLLSNVSGSELVDIPIPSDGILTRADSAAVIYRLLKLNGII